MCTVILPWEWMTAVMPDWLRYQKKIHCIKTNICYNKSWHGMYWNTSATKTSKGTPQQSAEQSDAWNMLGTYTVDVDHMYHVSLPPVINCGSSLCYKLFDID